MFGIDAILALAGLVLPPAFDFIKKKFIKGEAYTPERTIGELASSKPEVLPAYNDSLAKVMDARTKWFNRDVIEGKVSSFVANWRAAIRPFFVTASILHWSLSIIFKMPIDPEIRRAEILLVSEWVGERLSLK